MGTSNRKKCKCCKTLFIPDPRNASLQGYCSKPECRKTSKMASQHRWFKKPENRHYFSGPINVARVQEWRKSHPGYWKKKKPALQDSLNAQHAVLIGLIANITGLALQDDIYKPLLRLQQLGQDILNPLTHFKGGLNDIKTPHLNKPHPEGPFSVQLDRSQTCARSPY